MTKCVVVMDVKIVTDAVNNVTIVCPPMVTNEGTVEINRVLMKAYLP